jgi:hypothetical protein
MRRHWFAWSAALAALTTLACSTPSSVTTNGRPCAQSTACMAYLAKLEQRVHRAWRPFGVEQGSVELVFKLSPDGEVTDLSILSERPRGLDDSCETAFLAATPFEPPPPEIAAMPLHLTFALGGR